MPSLRLYEGVVKMLNKLQDKVGEYGSMIAILCRELKPVESSALSTQPFGQLGLQLQGAQLDEAVGPAALSQQKFPPLENPTVMTQPADQPAAGQGGHERHAGHERMACVLYK